MKYRDQLKALECLTVNSINYICALPKEKLELKRVRTGVI